MATKFSLSDKIRIRRRALGMSQEELARSAGITLMQISRIERGVSADPHLSTLRKIARALSFNLYSLLG